MLVLSRAVVNFYHFTANVASNVTLHAQLYGSRLLAVQIALNTSWRRTCCAARVSGGTFSFAALRGEN
jgi:hypothetical protein